MGQPLTFSASWHAWWLFKNIYQKTCQPGKRKIMCDLISVNKYLKGWCREDGASSAQGKDKRLWAQTQPQKVLSQHQQTLSLWGWLSTSRDCPGRLQSVHPWRHPKASSKWPFLSRGLDQMISRGPFQPQPLGDSLAPFYSPKYILLFLKLYICIPVPLQTLPT